VDNLIKRKIIIVDWYCMCKTSGETNWSLVIALHSCEELVITWFFFLWDSLDDATEIC
jgi:hypothetical protein